MEHDTLPAPPDDELPTSPHEEVPTDPTIGAQVLRNMLREVLAPTEKKLDEVHRVTTTTADSMVAVVTKVDQLVESQERDRRDIDRILHRLGMAAQ
jgi:hypothetical protein